MGHKPRPEIRKARRWGFSPGSNVVQTKGCRADNMRYVFVNGKCVYMGNTWDFRPEVHGVYDMGKWYGTVGLARVLAKACEDAGWECSIEGYQDLTLDESMKIYA